MTDEEAYKIGFEQSAEFFGSMLKESDRGCVLLVVARLDELLERLHRAHIHATTKAPDKLIDKLFRWPGVLSSFAGRIQIGYIYGLIPKATFRDLETMRELRNEAAHTSHEFSFAKTKERVFTLQLPSPPAGPKKARLLSEISQEEKTMFDSLPKTTDKVKSHFVSSGVNLCVWTMQEILNRFSRINAEIRRLDQQILKLQKRRGPKR